MLISLHACSIQFDDSVGTQGVQSYRCFHIQPSHSNLYPNDKPHTVAITFRPDKEVEFKNVNIFKIQVCSGTGQLLLVVEGTSHSLAWSLLE